MRARTPLSDIPAPTWPDEPVGPSRGRGLGDDLGAGLVEYGLLALIIAVACIGSLTLLAPVITGFLAQFTASL